MEGICQTCLVTSVHLKPMSVEEMGCYRLFVLKIEDPLDVIYVCVYCKGIIKRINQFIKQCRLADELLKNYCNGNLDTLQKINLKNLSTSEIICHYIGPETDFKYESDDKISDDDDDDDIPLVMFSQNDDDYDCNNYYNDEELINDNIDTSIDNIKQEPDTHTDIKEKQQKFRKEKKEASQGFSSRMVVETDEYKVIKLTEEEDNIDTSIDNIKQEPNTHTDIKRKQKKFRKKKKEARQGFSSRMVVETDEYKVIKLTKEEIIEEMREHSESEKYKMLPYKCKKCVRGFNFEDVLQSHMDKHSPKNGPFQCEICTQYCPSRVSLRGHMKSHSTRYKCKLCGLVRLSRQHILEHYSLQHMGSPALYTCPKCDHTTNKRTAMQRHVRLHATSEPLKCHYCGKYYKTKESLRIHILRHDDKKLHQCQICTSTFVYAAQMTKHMKSVHVLKDYYCVECDIMFKSMDNLKQHLQRAKRHRDDASYKFHCTECPQKFISASTLATHHTNAHGAAKSVACSLCPRAYSSAEGLRWHTRRAHTALDKSKLPCPMCDRTFSRKYVLRVHMRTHTGERPHVCECGAAFAQPAALRAHRTLQHKKQTVTAENET